MQQPAYYYVPSIATSGLAFYSGRQFPEWQDDAFIGALRAFHLNRVDLSGDEAVGEHRLQNRDQPRERVCAAHEFGQPVLPTHPGILRAWRAFRQA